MSTSFVRTYRYYLERRIIDNPLPTDGLPRTPAPQIITAPEQKHRTREATLHRGRATASEKHQVTTETKGTRRQSLRPDLECKTPRTLDMMRTRSTWLMLLTAWAFSVAAKGDSHQPVDINTTTAEAGGILTPQDNRNGWVNPEDLIPMPQCIAQQDPSAWLSTMTGCTGRRCTRHFGVICTHHQWLTQASCLSTGFSSDVVATYLPYCSRSVLSKAQLYRWIHATTGRTWLVDVGDANELQNLSPASLSKGYAAVSVTNNAPTCLVNSVSALSTEPFQHVLASCSFTSTTQHTGRADRPWEYRQDLHSMVPLDFETAGYDLTRGRIGYGDYFDKECFCRAFTIDTETEPCSGPGHLGRTQERLWLHVTCGPTSLPSNWMDSLILTGFDYIPIEDWHGPPRVLDLSRWVTELVDYCATDACGLDSSGYCKVQRTVDRACACRKLSLETCGGACQDFETRIPYVEWLHGLCGDVQDWHGLPDDWRRLAVPTARDMIPWEWTVKASGDSNECASESWKLGSFVFVNVATFLAVLAGRGAGIHRRAPRFPRLSSWFSTGMVLAAMQLLANWVNAVLVQGTRGYEDVPVARLVFLWCSMPRLAWLTFLLIGLQPFDAIDFAAGKSCLFAELVLQALSAYYMVLTVDYGRKHNFYFGGLGSAERAQSAKTMYAGALLWLVITLVPFVWLIRIARRMNRVTGSGDDDMPKRRGSRRTTSIIAEELMAKFDEPLTWLGAELESCWMDKSNVRALGETSSLVGGERHYTTYGTLPVQSQGNRKELAELYVVTTVCLLLLWIAQWVFWAGFIGLSPEEYVFMHKV